MPPILLPGLSFNLCGSSVWRACREARIDFAPRLAVVSASLYGGLAKPSPAMRAMNFNQRDRTRAVVEQINPAARFQFVHDAIGTRLAGKTKLRADFGECRRRLSRRNLGFDVAENIGLTLGEAGRVHRETL